jgi:hypothetical protein
VYIHEISFALIISCGTTIALSIQWLPKMFLIYNEQYLHVHSSSASRVSIPSLTPMRPRAKINTARSRARSSPGNSFIGNLPISTEEESPRSRADSCTVTPYGSSPDLLVRHHKRGSFSQGSAGDSPGPFGSFSTSDQVEIERRLSASPDAEMLTNMPAKLSLRISISSSPTTRRSPRGGTEQLFR